MTWQQGKRVNKRSAGAMSLGTVCRQCGREAEWASFTQLAEAR